MTKFIFTVTTAVASMLGQVYESTATVTDSAKAEKIVPADSTRCLQKKEMRVLTSKKQIPS